MNLVTTDHQHIQQLPLKAVRPVVVVGKIIIDEYQSPQDDKAIISIGGGGPQAAWGAAAALAVLTSTPIIQHDDNDNNDDNKQQQLSQNENVAPPQQPVLFFGPVGGLDWSLADDAALLDLIGSAVQQVHTVRGERLRTPRIRLWHDEHQTIQWKPLYDSFGEEGARLLWNHRPCAIDILNELDKTVPPLASSGWIGHAIMEAGAGSPGDGKDAAAFWDAQLQQRIQFLGIEPVAFPQEATGLIATADAETCIQRLKQFGSILKVVSPDDELFRALEASILSSTPPLVLDPNWEFAIRNGPHGSRILQPTERNDVLTIPAATLETIDGKPVNPTGAGNAYSAAYTTCRGNGLSPIQAASIAAAIGAVLCEYRHIPPWNSEVLARIQRAVSNVQTNVIGNVPTQRR